MTKREKKIKALRRRGLSERQIEFRMREWDLAEIRIAARNRGEHVANQYGVEKYGNRE